MEECHIFRGSRNSFLYSKNLRNPFFVEDLEISLFLGYLVKYFDLKGPYLFDRWTDGKPVAIFNFGENPLLTADFEVGIFYKSLQESPLLANLNYKLMVGLRLIGVMSKIFESIGGSTTDKSLE